MTQLRSGDTNTFKMFIWLIQFECKFGKTIVRNLKLLDHVLFLFFTSISIRPLLLLV